MKITQVKIHEYNKDKLRAFATITLEEQFVVSGLKVMDSVNGYFVAMPSQKNNRPNNGEENYKAYIDTAYPITKEFREEIQTAVLTEFHKAIGTYTEPHIDVPTKNEEQRKYDSVDVSEDDLPF